MKILNLNTQVNYTNSYEYKKNNRTYNKTNGNLSFAFKKDLKYDTISFGKPYKSNYQNKINTLFKIFPINDSIENKHNTILKIKEYCNINKQKFSEILLRYYFPEVKNVFTLPRRLDTIGPYIYSGLSINCNAIINSKNFIQLDTLKPKYINMMCYSKLNYGLQNIDTSQLEALVLRKGSTISNINENSNLYNLHTIYLEHNSKIITANKIDKLSAPNLKNIIVNNEKQLNEIMEIFNLNKNNIVNLNNLQVGDNVYIIGGNINDETQFNYLFSNYLSKCKKIKNINEFSFKRQKIQPPISGPFAFLFDENFEQNNTYTPNLSNMVPNNQINTNPIHRNNLFSYFNPNVMNNVTNNSKPLSLHINSELDFNDNYKINGISNIHNNLFTNLTNFAINALVNMNKTSNDFEPINYLPASNSFSSSPNKTTLNQNIKNNFVSNPFNTQLPSVDNSYRSKQQKRSKSDYDDLNNTPLKLQICTSLDLDIP